MKTGFDAVGDVFSLLNVPILKAAITGKVYQFSRLANSDKIDVVIGSLTITNEPIQTGIINVRIHAPNQNLNLGGGYSDYPDMTVFNSILNIIRPLLNDQFKDTFNTEIINPGTLMKNTDGTWFMHIQLNYGSYNKNFKNI
jgi:hypothetical protein